jgi:hypothetical protein
MYEDWTLELCATKDDHLVKNAFGTQFLDFIRRNLSYLKLWTANYIIESRNILNSKQ